MIKWTGLLHADTYFKDPNGLLYFKDTDFKPKLCTLHSKCSKILADAYELPFEIAYSATEKLWSYLSAHMGANIKKFCISCNICQKTKCQNSRCYGTLISNPIP